MEFVSLNMKEFIFRLERESLLDPTRGSSYLGLKKKVHETYNEGVHI
jgi:hypothetical protein